MASCTPLPWNAGRSSSTWLCQHGLLNHLFGQGAAGAQKNTHLPAQEVFMFPTPREEKGGTSRNPPCSSDCIAGNGARHCTTPERCRRCDPKRSRRPESTVWLWISTCPQDHSQERSRAEGFSWNGEAVNNISVCLQWV